MLVRRPPWVLTVILIGLGLCLQFGLMPLIGWALAHGLSLPPELLVGMVLGRRRSRRHGLERHLLSGARRCGALDRSDRASTLLRAVMVRALLAMPMMGEVLGSWHPTERGVDARPSVTNCVCMANTRRRGLMSAMPARARIDLDQRWTRRALTNVPYPDRP